MECWRLLFDATAPKPADQFPGWPLTISVADNYGREAVAWLPTLAINGVDEPVIHVETATGEHVYSLRIHGKIFSPKVFSEGTFRVTVEHPETGRSKTVTVQSRPKPGGRTSITLPAP